MRFTEADLNRSDEITNLSESAVISLARRVRHYGASRVIQGIGDDCAVIRTPGSGALLITSDVFIEGVHFLPDQPPESVGGKLLAVNLSDVAAMGGHPGEAVVDLMLPDTTKLEWVERFFNGLGEVAKRFEVNLVGGDTSRHPDRITLSLTLIGRCRKDEVVYRKGAQPGDLVYVSGTLGDADAGLELFKILDLRFKIETATILKGKYISPEPRVELGRLLAKTRSASAMIDLSDGIAVGARQLAAASGVAVELEAEALPISNELMEFCDVNGNDPIDWALKAGGDYELLFTVPAELARQVNRFGLKRPELPRLTCIGKVASGVGVTVKHNGQTEPLSPGGWEHFQS